VHIYNFKKKRPQTKLHASFLTNFENLDNQKRKAKKIKFINPKEFYLSTFVLKKKKQKSQKIKPSHYNQKKENKPSFS
jgi:hypothetical protein